MVLSIYIQATIVGWQVYELTNNPWDLGMVGLAEAIPSIVVALYAGHLADNFERKMIIQISLFFLFICSFLLWTFTYHLNFLLINYSAYPIFIVIFLSGIARGFISPAIFGFVTQLLPREKYPESAAWMGTSFQAGAVLGPALGGLVYAQFGIGAAYLLDAFFMGFPFVVLLFVPPRPLPKKTRQESLVESLFAGLRFVKTQKLMLGAMSLDMFAVLFGGATALLPMFAKDILHVDSDGLGYLRAAPSMGAFFVGYFLTRFPPMKHSGLWLIGAVVGFGLSMVLFGMSENYVLSLAALFFGGGFDSISVVIRGTIMQTMTPEDMRGRVSAINKIFIGSSNEIGAFESGVTASWFGPVGSVVGGGLATIAVVVATLIWVPEMKKLRLSDWT